MTRAYEIQNEQYDFLADGKCKLIKGNESLGNIIVNPNNKYAEIFFEKGKLQEFCNDVCENKEICVQSTKDEIIRLVG